MRYQDYNCRNLSRFLYPVEVSLFNSKDIIDIAIRNIYGNIEDELCITQKNKKISFYSKETSFKVLYRKIAYDLLKNYGGKTPSRNKIIKDILIMLRENFPYRVFKLDISSFYENFDQVKLEEDIGNLSMISPYSKKFMLSVLRSCCKKVEENYPGAQISLPRGINFSGVIANILMRDFDSYLEKNSDVFYYSRFVDDIILITSKDIDNDKFIQEASNRLYEGLKLNDKKQVICDSDNVNIDYLGYSIKKSGEEPNRSKIGSTFESRENYCNLDIGISYRKVNKIKNRISRSFMEYIKDKDEGLLIDRIKFLAANKYIIDKKTLKKRINGIRYNYPLLTNDSSLDELDKFVSFLLYSDKSRLSRLVKNNLSVKLKKKIKLLSFKKLYNNNVFFSFSPKKIIEIQECWKYE